MSKIRKEKEFSLPHNILAEELVLGSMCLDKTNISLVLRKLPIDTFYLSEHKILYKSLIDLYQKDKEINLTQIINYLQEKDILETIGGVSFLVNIINKVVTTINLEKYILLLQEKYFRRLLILLGKYIIEVSYDQKKDLKELLEDIESRIFTITEKRFNDSIGNTTELISSILLDIQFKFQNLRSSSGLLTSYYNLDALTQGFQNSELIIIAGRPSMGKTAFSLNLAKNILENYDISILIFSLEMSKQQLIYRFISIITGLNLIKLRSGNLTSIEWNLFQEGIKNLSKQSIYIDDNSEINLSEIQTKIRQMIQKKNKLGLIIIDYLQLMKLAFSNENRAQELSSITRNLKILAKELNLPIIVLSQLSRNVESRIDKRPILSDLRDSGCIGFKTILNKKFNSNNNFLYINSFIKKFFFTGQKPIYKMRNFPFLKDFQASTKHKFFTNYGWKKLQDFSFKTKLPIFSNLYIKSLFWTWKKNFDYKDFNLVYDIEINKNSIYLFNSNLFHNSIEQDADIVLMLYRDDYYNINPITNITELILAKHRNGPIGLVKLVFDKTSLQFKNCPKEASIS